MLSLVNGQVNTLYLRGNILLFIIHHSGNHTIAVIKGHENYDLLKVSCAKIFDCINRLARKGTVKVKDKDIRIEMFLGGDYKVY
jgi:hypothetical protein